MYVENYLYGYGGLKEIRSPSLHPRFELHDLRKFGTSETQFCYYSHDWLFANDNILLRPLHPQCKHY